MTGLDLEQADCPPDVVDRLLWRGAQRILDRHTLRRDGTCRWCDRQGPCSPRRLAQRADAKARQPWHDGWISRTGVSRLLPAPEIDYVALIASGEGVALPGPRRPAGQGFGRY